jgi:predicted nuclease of restriction endonuclease-like RecB superfamily
VGFRPKDKAVVERRDTRCDPGPGDPRQLALRDVGVQGARRPGLLELDRLVVTRELRPNYVTSADGPWLRALLDERSRFVGQTRRTWRARLAEPLGVAAPSGKLRVATRVLDRGTRDRVTRALAPRKLRRLLFRAAARHDSPAALAEVTQQLGLDEAAIMSGLFADLPDERRLAPLPAALDAVQLALLCNESIVSELLQRALRVRIRARGQMRAVVRHAKCMGLLCVVRPQPENDSVVLEVSGPFALFRHTRLYGSALASLVPRLARCDTYQLEAECVMQTGGEVGRLILRSADPIVPARELPAYDSKLEARIAADFAKLALEWEVIREPAPIALDDGLLFPDFELRRRTTGERFWLEVVGFWTPEYLANKLAQLRKAHLSHLILCVDATRQCDDGELEALGLVVRFRRRIDARAVVAIVDPALAVRLAERDKTDNTDARRSDHSSRARRPATARARRPSEA